MDKPLKDIEFVLKANDKSFERVYFPYVTVRESDTLIEYKYPYNYDILIEFKFNSSTGKLEEGRVMHEIKGWSFDIDSATEIRGFEGNKPEFDFLKSKTTEVIRDNINLIKQSISNGKTFECEGNKYFDSVTLEDAFKKESKQSPKS
jgi:hypothetical protein